jgi:hypothetical protein
MSDHMDGPHSRQFFKAHQRQVVIATGVNEPLSRAPAGRLRLTCRRSNSIQSTAVTLRLKTAVQRSIR